MSYKKITIFHAKQLLMIRLLQKWVINTFGFSKSETNGSLILVGLVILVAIIPRLFLNTQKTAEVSTEADKVTLHEWYSSIEFSYGEDFDQPQETESFSPPKLNLKRFDPNAVSLQELETMGIPQNVANNLINYRNAGGSYHIKSDMQKIYGMSERLYASLESFVLLPDKLPTKTIEQVPSEIESWKAEPAKALKSIAINSATAKELEVIRGIGPTLSERIIKYRDLLGGFHSQDQLHEVYGLSNEVIEEINNIIVIDSITTTVNINVIDLKSLSAHPYISYPLAKAIINYRTVHGPFEEKTGLKRIKIVSDSLYNKLSPYISVRP